MEQETLQLTKGYLLLIDQAKQSLEQQNQQVKQFEARCKIQSTDVKNNLKNIKEEYIR